jgi:hypothetical protein
VQALVKFSPEDSDTPWVEEKLLARSLDTVIMSIAKYATELLSFHGATGTILCNSSVL